MFGSKNDPARTVDLVKDDGGQSAVDLNKIAQTSPDLAKKTQAAGIELAKVGLSGIRAQVVLVLDHSGSMRADYQSGDVQRLVERFLGFGLQVDEDGVIPVIPFDARVRPTVEVGLHNYRDVVDREIWAPGDMGSTNMAAAFEVVRELAKVTDLPILCGVATDGNPDNRAATTKIVKDLARYPVQIKFLALRPVEYLSELDDLDDSQRLLDNVDTKPAPDWPVDLLRCTDQEFAAAMADEWDSWFAAAQKAGVLR